jgi:hypothetical protein
MRKTCYIQNLAEESQLTVAHKKRNIGSKIKKLGRGKDDLQYWLMLYPLLILSVPRASFCHLKRASMQLFKARNNIFFILAILYLI